MNGRYLQTERGLIVIQKEFASRHEAEQAGFCEAFTAHRGGYHLIYSKYNPEKPHCPILAEVRENFK